MRKQVSSQRFAELLNERIHGGLRVYVEGPHRLNPNTISEYAFVTDGQTVTMIAERGQWGLEEIKRPGNWEQYVQDTKRFSWVSYDQVTMAIPPAL